MIKGRPAARRVLPAGLFAALLTIAFACAQAPASSTNPLAVSADKPPLAATLRHQSLLNISIGGGSSSGPLISVSVGGSSSNSSSQTPLIGLSVLSEPPKSSTPTPPTTTTPTPPVIGAPETPPVSVSTAPSTGEATSPGGSSPGGSIASTSESARSRAAASTDTAAKNGSPAVGQPSAAPTAVRRDSSAAARRSRRAAGNRSSRAGGHTRQVARHATGATGRATSIAAPSATGSSTSHGGSAHPTRTSRARAHANTFLSGNPLESIGRRLALPIPVPDWSKPIILALLLLAVWFGVRSRLAAVRARRLEAQRVGLLHDLGVMQMALVPELPARLGALAVSVAYRPADGPAAGGDFFDMFVPQPGKVAIILGDVCGHGCEALNHAALTRYTLRAYLQAGLQPRAALALAGQALADPSGDHYATVVLGVYDEHSGRLTYASAGHPPPILRGLRRPHEHLMMCSSPPVGWGVPTGRRQSTVSLPAGSEVCFLSDGLLEARLDGELLGRERLVAILADLGVRPSAEDLLERVRAVTEPAGDDMAACIIAPEVNRNIASFRAEELEVDARLLGGTDVECFLEACGIAAPERARLIERAGLIAADHGTAVLRVELGPGGAVASAEPPGAGSAAKRDGLDSVKGLAQPLLEALSVT